MSDGRGPRSLDALATLIAVNVTPIAGIFFLGWQPAAVLVSYTVDTYVGFLSVILLLMIHVTGDEHDTPIEGWRRWSKLVFALAFFAALLVLPLVLPMLMVFGDDTVARLLLDDTDFLAALAVQVAMSAYAAWRVHRELRATHDDDRILTARGLFLAARWCVVFVAIGTGVTAALSPRLAALLVIAIYVGASVWFELFPEHAARVVRGHARPISYGKDLESRARDRGDLR